MTLKLIVKLSGLATPNSLPFGYLRTSQRQSVILENSIDKKQYL